MASTTVKVPLSEEIRARLGEVAARTGGTEAETAAALIEGALAADELEVEIIRRRVAEADAGGPFARQEEVLAWLRALSAGKPTPVPKATITID
jgi:predicted transcriptional regulator